MKRLFTAACLAAAVAAASVHGGESPAGAADEVPRWVRVLITQIQAQPVANPPSLIVQYEVDGRTFYYVPPRCCDIPSVLYDSNGKVLCSPDGGLTGRGDGRCPPGLTQLTGGRLLWRDPRKWR